MSILYSIIKTFINVFSHFHILGYLFLIFIYINNNELFVHKCALPIKSFIKVIPQTGSPQSDFVIGDTTMQK